MAQNYYESFKKKLEEIFMMDHAELDFGIYRIMNQKRNDIQRFLDLELLPQVKQVLEGNNGGEADKAKKRMAEIAASVGGNIEVLPKGTPMRDEYDKLEAQLAQSADTESMQAEVFSHLVTFFSRYYDGGDFLSKRRYKDNTYAIPYNGEEVKLHWANSDQYYIKTSEYFRDYTFVLPTSRKKVHFVLKDASTEQNNNRAANNMERRFALYVPENDEPIVETTADGELNIYFTYELMPKATKQDALKAEAFETVKTLIPAEYEEMLTTKVPTQKEPNRTLLEKHLTDYTAKNSFDYFIHKDLGGFLHRELDFYIKNEVLHIDDLDARFINSQLTIVRAIKQVGEKIICMLAQLENFQKKLWLKKKFVVQSDYCITLDRVPEKIYPEIIANEAQRKEWVRLFAIDEIKGDLTTEAYSEPLTIEFLKQNPFLVLDTAFFDAKFKHQLVKSMENVDEQTNGLLINSENFQALQLLQEKLSKSVKCVYIDPPYNAPASEVLYKNSFKHSAWISMMDSRLNLSKRLLSTDGSHCIAIDKYEHNNLFDLCKLHFPDMDVVSVAIEHNKKGTMGDHFSFSNEYAIFAVSYNLKHLNEKTRKKEDWDYSNLRNWGGESERGDAANCFYPIFVRNNKVIGYGDVLDDAIHPSAANEITTGKFEIYTPDGVIEVNGSVECITRVWPIDPEGVERKWRYAHQSILEIYDKLIVENGRDGSLQIKMPKFSDQFKTLWADSIYNAGDNGTKVLTSLGFTPNDFAYPKSVYTVKDCVYAISDKESIVLDYFAGSGTTAQSVLNLNAEDKGHRRYFLCEMGNYFKTVTKPRIEKVIFSRDWRDGKPISHNGISQCFKYIRLEQYEDTLNNLEIKKQQMDWRDDEFHESYMLNYMLDTETRDSLLNLKMFVNPFNMSLKTTKDNELVETKVDMVETFNYLIGLNVETEDWFENDNICVVQGKTHRRGLKTLVIWRNCEEIDNEKLCRFFDRMDFRTRDTEFDLIYVNGDNTLPNLRRDEENWKVVLTEEEFAKRMFEEA
ncbi:MAG: site-specific DNA-methyltransferase [Bacteroidaceae bacterium]|nr:site-specific DNA-methyltransferase [Bacteroidaceae bacterium]